MTTEQKASVAVSVRRERHIRESRVRSWVSSLVYLRLPSSTFNAAMRFQPALTI